MTRGELLLSIQLWLVVILVAQERRVLLVGIAGFIAGSIALLVELL